MFSQVSLISNLPMLENSLRRSFLTYIYIYSSLACVAVDSVPSAVRKIERKNEHANTGRARLGVAKNGEKGEKFFFHSFDRPFPP